MFSSPNVTTFSNEFSNIYSHFAHLGYAALVQPNNSSNHDQHNSATEGISESRAKHTKEKSPVDNTFNYIDVANSPHVLFEQFVDEEMIQWLIEKVNNSTKLKTFHPVTLDELKCVIGILLLSSYNKVPRKRMYWELSPDCHNSLVANAMQRDRFEAIISKLVFSHNSDDIDDASSDVNILLAMINRKLMKLSSNTDTCSIGECFVWRNSKCDKTVKLWFGCEQNGYCNFLGVPPKSATESLQYGRTIMSYYIQLLKQNNHNIRDVFTMKCYNTEELAGEFSNQGIMLSSLDSNKGVLQRLQHNLNLYRTTLNNRWRTFLFLLALYFDIAVNNARILYTNKMSHIKNEYLDLLTFRRQIVLYYLQRYAKPKLVTKPDKKKITVKSGKLSLSEARYDGVRHFVISQQKQTRCGFCGMKTTTRCQKCDVGVHVKCFVNFHTKPKSM